MTTHLTDKNGNVIPHGSLITWKVEDRDDFAVWTFIGVVHDHTQLSGFFYGEYQSVVYLGGGIDFGSAIGSNLTFQQVQEDSENNDPSDRGISVLGLASDVPNILKKFYGI